MAQFEAIKTGDLGLVQQSEDGRIIQIGLTKEQSEMLQLFIGSLSKQSPLVRMPKEYDLAPKANVCKRCQSK